MLKFVIGAALAAGSAVMVYLADAASSGGLAALLQPYLGDSGLVVLIVGAVSFIAGWIKQQPWFAQK
jgi:hypothetical protein